MPLKARINAPGALHHIIVHGIERWRIFSDDPDRENFIVRLGKIVTDTETFCFAWAVIPNHVHLDKVAIRVSSELGINPSRCGGPVNTRLQSKHVV